MAVNRDRSGSRRRKVVNRNALRVHYREPTKWFYPMVIALGLLTYLVFNTHTSHSSSLRILPKWASTPRTGLSKLCFMLPCLFEKTIVRLAYKIGHCLFGGMEGLKAIFVLSWGIHLIDLVYGIYLLITHRATGETMLKYIAGIIVGGCTQLWPLMEACKSVRRSRNGSGSGRSLSRSRSRSRSLTSSRSRSRSPGRKQR